MADVAQETNVSEVAEGEVFSDLFFPSCSHREVFPRFLPPTCLGVGVVYGSFSPSFFFSPSLSLSPAALAQLSKDPKFQSILQKHLAASKNSYEKYALNIIIIYILCVCGGGGC